MRWEGVFLVFVVCHVTGDFLLQTDWQAVHKRGGLSRNPEARRALFSHVTVYTLCFAPAVAWIASNSSALAIALLPVIFIPHLIQDDARALIAWNRRVKGGSPPPGDPVYMAIDQSFHFAMLFGTALLAVL
ncbi:MAG: hypothetical protein QOH13_1762 [Thermoleophilaceae bacterium]|nr:hypothetical protein [Thermoleophilaceae bacterium]